MAWVSIEGLRIKILTDALGRSLNYAARSAEAVGRKHQIVAPPVQPSRMRHQHPTIRMTTEAYPSGSVAAWFQCAMTRRSGWMGL
jgi:hypothetical protein